MFFKSLLGTVCSCLFFFSANLFATTYNFSGSFGYDSSYNASLRADFSSRNGTAVGFSSARIDSLEGAESVSTSAAVSVTSVTTNWETADYSDDVIANSIAELNYRITLNALTPFEDVNIPILIDWNLFVGSITGYPINDSGVAAYANASVSIRGTGVDINRSLSINSNEIFIEKTQSGTETINISSFESIYFRLTARAYSAAGTGEVTSGWQGMQAYADPLVYIDPSYEYADMFALDYAKGGSALPVSASISAVPVPAAVWLFGSGLIGLVGLARRKKS